MHKNMTTIGIILGGALVMAGGCSNPPEPEPESIWSEEELEARAQRRLHTEMAKAADPCGTNLIAIRDRETGAWKLTCNGCASTPLAEILEPDDILGFDAVAATIDPNMVTWTEFQRVLGNCR